MPGQKEYFIVSKIVGHRETDQGVEYRVNWAGYPSSADTWEPEKNLINCEEYIQQYIMSSLRGKKPRRSARLAQATSDEDFVQEMLDVVTTPISRTQKARQQSKRRTASPERAVKSYALRSASTHKHVTSGNASGDLTPSKPELTETRFRHSQRIADISRTRPVSSTPFTRSSRRQMEALSEDVLELRETVSAPAPDCTMGQADSSDDVEEEEDEGEVVEEENVSAAQEKGKPRSIFSRWAFRPRDFELGWKEVALSLFLSGIGVLGYICYYNDVCTYC